MGSIKAQSSGAIAVDGSKVQLPGNADAREAFGEGGNHLATVAMAGFSTLYDTLNDVMVDLAIVHKS